MSFQFSGSLSFINLKCEKSPTGFIHLSKTNTHVLYAYFMPAKNLPYSSSVPVYITLIIVLSVSWILNSE
jgi:hypothetical protein